MEDEMGKSGEEPGVRTVKVVCTGRDNPRTGETAHGATLLNVMVSDDGGRWRPATGEIIALGGERVRSGYPTPLHRGRTEVYRREGEERVLVSLPDGTEVRTGDETITVRCGVPGCQRQAAWRAEKWSKVLDTCFDRGVSLAISDPEFI